MYDRFCDKASQLHGARACSKSYFYSVWHKHRPTLKAIIGCEFVTCSLCTLYDDALNGGHGVRATEDPATGASTEAAKREHLGVRVSVLME